MTYRTDIDGLRAVAVISVLLAHLGLDFFAGGYIGVDVFFVVSGFLITSIISKEIKINKFSIWTFYERRIRRIFPALFVMLFVTTLIGIFILIPGHLKDYGQSLFAATLFISNIFFWKETGYFSATSETKPLLHTWSLGVEEQFYIFFPLMLVFLYYKLKKNQFHVLIFITISSFLLSVYGIVVKPSATFYLIPTRTWELLLGALLALGYLPEIKKENVANILAFVGIFLILIPIFVYDKMTPFPGLLALPPVLGTFLIIYTGENNKTFIFKLLSNQMIVFVGLLSYSLYLWHWPIIVYYKYWLMREIYSYEIIFLGGLSFFMAYLSWRFIETPFRKKLMLSTRKKIFIFAILSILLLSFVGLFLHLSKGFPQRLNIITKEVSRILENEEAKNKWLFPNKYNNFRNPLKKESEMNFYKLSKNKSEEILFWGDSHIGMIFPTIKELHKNINKDILIGTSGGCLPVREFNRIENGYFCDRFNELLYKKASLSNIKIIIIGSRWDYIGNKLKNNSQSLALETVSSKLESDIKELISKKKEVYIILPFPRYNYSVPNILEKRFMFNRFEKSKLSFENIENYSNVLKSEKILKSIAIKTGAKLIDPKEILCNENRGCLYEGDGVSLYRDSSHLNTYGALKLTQMFETLTKDKSNAK